MLMMLICVKCSSLTGIQIWNSKCVGVIWKKTNKKKPSGLNFNFLTLHSSTYLLNLFSFLFFFQIRKVWMVPGEQQPSWRLRLFTFCSDFAPAVNPNHIKGLIGFPPTQWDSSQSCGSLPLRKQSAVQMTIAPFYPPDSTFTLTHSPNWPCSFCPKLSCNTTCQKALYLHILLDYCAACSHLIIIFWHVRFNPAV